MTEEIEKEADCKKKDGSSSKSISMTPAITALLKPTTEYLGIELRDFVKGSVEEWKKKRREKNLNSHIEAVKQTLIEEPSNQNNDGPSLGQLSFFEEWMDCVQDVDPEDQELSSIWRRLLEQAARGQTHSPEIINALKSLSPREAKFLVEMGKRTPTFPIFSGIIQAEDRYLAKSLEQRNILEKDYAFSGTLIASLGLSVAFIYYFAKEINLPLELPVTGLFLATVVAAGAISLRSGLARWRPTWLGQQLMSTSKQNGRNVDSSNV